MPRITSIRKLAPQMTVDVEVEDTHSYQLDNGWVSHNTVSQLVDSASGIHPRHSRWYVRRARMDVKDPLVGLMKSAGFRVEPDVMKPEHTVVVSFPIEAPKNAVFRGDVDAIQHLELWKVYRDHWCDHNPSITVTVREDEWMRVGAWVYDNFDSMTGVSFLPHSDHVYRQAPYEELDGPAFLELLDATPKSVAWGELSAVEKADNTTGTQELNCSAGGCDVL